MIWISFEYLFFSQSVFKNYDSDQDGLICEEEFNSFVLNFPGLDSFVTVDKDRLAIPLPTISPIPIPIPSTPIPLPTN